MRIFKRVKQGIVVTVVLCAAGYVAYEVLLDEEAKNSIKSMLHEIRTSYLQLANMVDTQIGTIMDEEVVAQNRQQIRDAWADLGF